MADKTPRGVCLAYLKESVFRGGTGTFSSPTVTTSSMYAFDVLKAPPDPPLTYRTREEYWEIGEGRSLARITDLGYGQGEVSLELGLQTAIFLFYALGEVVNGGTDPYYHDISESTLDLTSMSVLYENNSTDTAGSDSNNDINKILFGTVVANVTIMVEQGAEITMTVDLMTALSRDLTDDDGELYLDKDDYPARFTLKVFTYEDFVQDGSWIQYASASISDLTSGTVSNVSENSVSISGLSAAANTYQGYYCRITAGQGLGQLRHITESDTDTITVSEAYVVPPSASDPTSTITIYDAGKYYGSQTEWVVTPSAIMSDLIGISDWTNVDSYEITITNTLEIRPCIGDPYPAKFVVGKREYSIRLHLYPTNHNTLLSLRNTEYCNYTGPVWGKAKFSDGCAGVSQHALEFNWTNLYLSDFPDHIPDWDEVIVNMDIEFRNAPTNAMYVNTVDDRSSSYY